MKREKGESWYSRGGHESVIFVPATPHSELKWSYMREVKRTELRIKTVERASTTLKHHLQKSDPFR